MESHSDEFDDRVRAELRDGERLVWSGQPSPARSARAARPIVLFGIAWTAFSVFWIVMASGIMFAAGNFPNGIGFDNLFSCFPLFGIPFVLIGIGMLTSPMWMRRKAHRTYYALTTKRVILWEPSLFGGVEVRSYKPEQLDRMVRREYADGSGDLIFEELIDHYRDGKGRSRTRTFEHGFIGIENVREVEEMIHKTLLSEK